VQSSLSRTLRGFITATHFGPTVLVVTISFFLSRLQYSVSDALQIAIAILAGQCVVGWTNDVVDLPLDSPAARSNKPLVAGSVTTKQLRIAISIALLAALLLSLRSPLGVIGTLVHALLLLSATAYNLYLKKTVLSVLPYVISFGGLPWAVYLSAGKNPPLWLVLGFIFISSSFHFLNVVKDLETDVAQGVLGLPQQVGRTASLLIASLLFIAGLLSVLLR
jgi:4-hydroxybenzoate polyprenyltransferase